MGSSRVVVLLAVAGLVVASCGGSDDDAIGGTTESTAETTAETSAQPDTAAAAPDTVAPTPTEPPPDSTEPPPPTTATIPVETSTTVSPSSPPVTPDELRATIDERLVTADGTVTLAQRIDDLAIPGAAIVVVADGAPIVRLANGTTPDGAPMQTDTILQVGSVSKPVAAAAIATLVSDGTIDWSTDVLASLAGSDLGGVAGGVSFEALLSHTAGANVDGFLGYPDPDQVPSAAEVIAGDGTTDAIVVTPPPEPTFLYSGGGYVVAAEAAAGADAATFAELARTRLFEPLGMVDSSFGIEPPADRIDRVSPGSVNGQGLANRWQRHPEHAAAGLWTTADDLGRFLIEFGASLAGTSDRALTSDVAVDMVTAVAMIDGGEGSGYAAIGRGWFLDDADSPSVYRHNGRNIGFTAEIAGTVDGRYGVVVVTNAFPGGTDLARDVIRTVAAELEWQS